MKKILYFFLMGLCSCSQNKEIIEVSEGVVESVNVSIVPIEYDVDSRLALSLNSNGFDYLWEDNDTIGVFPSKGGQVEFPITKESGVGTTFAKFNGGGWGLKGGYTYSAYYPYNFYNRDVLKIPFSYEGQVQDGSGSKKNLGRYLLSIAEPERVENGALNFKLMHVGCFFWLTLTMPEAGTFTSLDIYADSEIIPVKKTYDILSGDLSETIVDCSNCLHVDLKNITTSSNGEKVEIWVAFPTMSQSTKTLMALVTDSRGNKYKGEIVRSNGNPFYLELGRNKGYQVKASPLLTNSGVTGCIENWEIGEVIMGSAN